MSCVLPSSISPYTTVNMFPSVSGCSSTVAEREGEMVQVIKCSLFLILTVEDGCITEGTGAAFIALCISKIKWDMQLNCEISTVCAKRTHILSVINNNKIH